MEPYQALTDGILSGPGGKTTAAFFDLDGTIIATHSVKDVFMERLAKRQVKRSEVLDMATLMVRYMLKTEDFTETLKSSVRNMAGMDESEFIELTEKVTRDRLIPQVFPEMRAIIRAHQAKGHSLVIISSASRYQVQALARELGIDDILCTELEVVDGKFTGELNGPPCYGSGKLTTAKAYAKGKRVSLAKSYFYSNGSEDLPLLKAVAHPVIVAPDDSLRTTAEGEGWVVYDWNSRGSAGVGDIARSVAAFGMILPTLAATLPFRLLGANARDTANLSISTWASIATIISRLKLIVDGEQHVWSRRPAVFIFNHQSAIDMLITAKLLREDIVAVAKQEASRQPLIGPALKFLGTVFVDRDNVKDPREALAPAIAALASGKSIVIAPEGTRSRDGRLGKFKRGAFHLAQQTGVPIVPIVIHNANDALPNKSMVIRPAEIKVTILPPIDTAQWTLRSVAPESRRIRDMMKDVLGPAEDLAEEGHTQSAV